MRHDGMHVSPHPTRYGTPHPFVDTFSPSRGGGESAFGILEWGGVSNTAADALYLQPYVCKSVRSVARVTALNCRIRPRFRQAPSPAFPWPALPLNPSLSTSGATK